MMINLAFHAVNGLLLFLLFKKITKRNDISLSAAGLFLINSRVRQIPTWPQENFGILLTAFLILFLLLLFINYLRTTRFLLFLVGIAGLYFFVSKVTNSMSSALPLATYAFRVLAIPLKGISQTFFPEKLMIKAAEIITTVAYPNFVSSKDGVNPYISRVIVFDLLAYLLTIAILVFSFSLFYFFKKPEDKRFGKIIFFSFLFIIVSFLPLIFTPGDSGYFSILKPENLYLATMGASLIGGIFVFLISNLFKKWKIQKKIFFGILAVVFLINIL